MTFNATDIVSNIVAGSNSGSIIKNRVTFSVTKTGGSTSHLNATYPTGAPLNTIPMDWTTNIEGLHMGRTWGANGTGWVIMVVFKKVSFFIYFLYFIYLIFYFLYQVSFFITLLIII